MFDSDDFNPRSREGSDESHTITISKQTIFQSTLPRGERQCQEAIAKQIPIFQSTLPRGERPECPLRNGGRTKKFQSTLPRGERRWKIDPACKALRFQSTLPRGERRAPKSLRQRLEIISIHAPARGATVETQTAGPPRKYFNPRSREGSDIKNSR